MHWWKFCQQLNFFRRCGSWELSRFYSLLISIMMWSHRARRLQSRFYPLANNVVTTVPPSTIELHFWFFVPMLFLATFPPNQWTVRSTTRRNNFRPLIFHMWVYEFPRRNIDKIRLWAQNNSLFHQAKLGVESTTIAAATKSGVVVVLAPIDSIASPSIHSRSIGKCKTQCNVLLAFMSPEW